VIRNQHLQQQHPNREEHRHEMTMEARYKLRDFPHGRNVCRDIKDIRDQQQEHDALQYGWWERRLDVGGKSLPGDAADARAHGLNRGHQRPG